jgi:hypothetical protein
VESKNKSDTGNSRANWNHLKITQILPEKHTAKARNQVTAENKHIGHCTQTAGSAHMKVQNAYHWK